MMMKAHSHLSDDQLIELCLVGDPPQGGYACVSCDARHAELAALLRDVSAAAVQDADAAFPADRLARQQARILQRLEQDGRPGRLIAFPGHGHDAAPLRARPSSRWLAGAAAAGLVIGLVAGHLASNIPGRAAAPAPMARATDAGQPATLRAVATSFSEDEFLGQIESIAESPGGDALRPLHDATPRAWEVK
jgi:hypothetical protein